MNTAIMKFLAAGLLGVSLVGAKAPSVNVVKNSASIETSSSAASGVGTAKPGKAVSVFGAPGFIKQGLDSQDEIVQLNSLVIQSISGNLISAGQLRQVWCIKAPCPMMPDRLFNVNVNVSSILLFRNRNRASLSDFAVGEHINVYGFENQDNSVDALIVRDLDKPELIQPVELNNMEVTAINGSTLTVQLHFSCKSEICPMMERAQIRGTKADSRIMPMMYPMPRNVVVNSNTKFMDRNGNAIGLADIKVGDIVNVKGTMRGVDFNADVTAKSLEDSSIPVVKSASLSVVSFSGPGKLQVNQIGTWDIRIADANQDSMSYSISWGDAATGGTATPQHMEKDGDSFGGFTHAYSAPGTYTVTITVTDTDSKTATATSNVYVF